MCVCKRERGWFAFPGVWVKSCRLMYICGQDWLFLFVLSTTFLSLVSTYLYHGLYDVSNESNHWMLFIAACIFLTLSRALLLYMEGILLVLIN
jgi:hypothetical protein